MGLNPNTKCLALRYSYIFNLSPDLGLGMLNGFIVFKATFAVALLT